MGVHLPKRAARLPVRGVLLDVFVTLFPFRGVEPAFAACGLDPGLVAGWIGCVMSNGIAIAAASDYRRFSDVAYNAFLELAPARLGQADFQGIMAALRTLEPHPDVRDSLEQLRRSSVRVLTLSSMDKGMTESLFAHAGLADLVDGHLATETVRRWKPAPEAYSYGAAQIGWPPSQVALISAHEWDIHGGRRAGLQTAHVLRRPQLPSSVFDRADYWGETLPAVVAQLLDGKPQPGHVQS
jgi:2-haloacid dehalogenase